MGSFLGPALGALFYLMFRDICRSVTENWQFWFGLLFMASILFSPDGLVGLGERADGAAAAEARDRRRPWRARRRARRRLPRLPGRAAHTEGRCSGAAAWPRASAASPPWTASTSRCGSHAARPDRPQRRGQDHAVQPDLGHVRARPGRSCSPGNPIGGLAPETSRRRAWPLVPDHQPVPSLNVGEHLRLGVQARHPQPLRLLGRRARASRA